MAEVIEMPKLSDTMEEGGIASWLKKEGDFIEEGEAFVEIETDKATMEYNSPVEGYLLKILVPAGKTSPLNKPICVVGEKGEKFDGSAAGGDSKASLSSSKTYVKESSKPETINSTVAPVKTGMISESDRLRASPLAKKIAEEKKIDLKAIQGSGPGGRVIKRDLEGSSKAPPSESREREPVGAPRAAVSIAGDYEDLPVNMMRKTIAKRLLAAKNDAPHFYLTRSANMKKINEWRELLNKDADKDTKVSVNDLIVLAVSRALIRHPEVNSSWQGETIRRYRAAHVAVAVAIPDGLITPVVRNAHALGVREIARQTKDLITRTKAGKIAPDEYAGGTFSISNLGMMGIENFTAIINPPQAAILAIGSTIKTPWVNATGELEVQDRMTMTMSCDHRVIDGAVGAAFLQTLTRFLEDPLAILA
jgi:pyruvate dehydrogenase E2 component (dihydrolipoamide acetyltransferase)